MTTVGTYELLERIGEGGTAEVFRARDAEGDECAVKLLTRRGETTEAERARFEREVRVAARLEHPHLIRVIDHGVDPARGPWLVMPLVSGMTLRDFAHGKLLCPEAALRLLVPVVEALAAMHHEGLVHRDVKPENVMLGVLGDVTLVDLGLALGEADTRHTAEGEVTGSLPYMSRERIEGGDVGPSADVFAIGVMLYELVTGTRPFERARPGEEVAAILGGSFTALKEADRRVDAALDDLVARCLAPDADARPRDAQALLASMRAQIDEPPKAQRAARVSILTDHLAYQRAVAPRVVRAARDAARERMAAGDGFEALRLLDRALAYLPEDPETLALFERAVEGDFEVAARAVSSAPAPRAAPRARRTLWLGLGLAGLASVGALAVVLGAEAPAEDAASDAARVAEPPPPAVADAGVAALVFQAIPPGALSNDDPAELDDVAAAPGAPLIEANEVGGDAEAALREADRALEEHPGDPALEKDRALAWLALGRTAEGLSALEALHRDHDGNVGVLTALGFVRMRQGRFDEADTLFGRALAIDPTHILALRHRGILRRRRGQTRDAYQDLARVLELDPDNVYALGEMTEIFERARRVHDAAPILRRLVANLPRNAEAWASLSIVLGVSSEPTELDEALRAVDHALELDPSNHTALAQRCTLRARLERPRVVEACDAAIEAMPSAVDLFTARAREHARLGQFVEALADADRTVELQPADARHYANRAILRGLSGDEARAVEDLQRACELGHAGSCARLRMDGR